MSPRDDFYICPNCMTEMTSLDEVCPNCGKPNNCFDRATYQAIVEEAKEKERDDKYYALIKKDEEYLKKQEEYATLLHKLKRVAPFFVLAGVMFGLAVSAFFISSHGVNQETRIMFLVIGIIASVASFTFLVLAICFCIYNKRIRNKLSQMFSEIREIKQRVWEESNK